MLLFCRHQEEERGYGAVAAESVSFIRQQYARHIASRREVVRPEPNGMKAEGRAGRQPFRREEEEEGGKARSCVVGLQRRAKRARSNRAACV